MSCKPNSGTFRYLYTGNEVGWLNFVGLMNFVAGGPPGSGISSGEIVKKFFPDNPNRALWELLGSELSQELLDACYPFIELNWIADITIDEFTTFRVSSKNLYVEDHQGLPRFYEARAERGPSVFMTAGEWLNPNFETGDVQLVINNRDGFFNDYLPHGVKYTQWIGGKVSIKIGFGEHLSNYFEVFRGFIPEKKGLETGLEDITITAYDRFDEDEVSIPSTSFDRTNYPLVDIDKSGAVIPIIYGDWSTEVNSYGDVPAFCANAQDDAAQSYIWIISENALREIGDVYLHRGNRTPEQQGPIKLLNNAITKQPERGRILIPAGITALSEKYFLIENGKPGSGSGLNLIIAESSEQNFIKLGVQIGDQIFKEGSSTPAIVISVSTGILTLSGGQTFSTSETYKVVTDRYVYRKGDKISVICKGKDLEVMAVTRIADSELLGVNPLCLSIGLNNDYWFVNNDAQIVYQVSFDDEVLRQIDYADIDPSITNITGIDIQTDGTLWLFERGLSKLFRYVLSENAVGKSFTTLQVSGLEALLSSGGPLTIDSGNIITIVDQSTGEFYRINPFAGDQPGLVNQFNRNDFEPLATDIIDIDHDVNLDQLLVLDRNTGKFYRVDPHSGGLISGSVVDLEDRVSENFIQPRGIGYYIDGSIFLLNKQDNSIYNFNEFEDCSENPGFIARDILQAYAGKSTFDFGLKWNETCREDLSQFKARISIDDKTTAVTYLHKFLLAFNTNLYLDLQKYSLFHIAFDNFTTEGRIIREGDIKFDSFNPQKESSQYFNTSVAKYKRDAFTNRRIESDVYVSPTGVEFAGSEIKKELDMFPIYRRSDVDILIPLFLRLASAEPEFVSLSVGFRFLFAQMNSFYNINFKDLFNINEKSGRRFDNIPAFVRRIQINLDTMEIKLKLWSLGTTQFGNFKPVGTIAGGQNDQIILTNLGTPGYVSPIGTILSAGVDEVTLEDVSLEEAEDREDLVTGNAWNPTYVVGIYEGVNHQLLERLAIDSVTGQVVKFTQEILTSIVPTVKNSAGFIVGGHYLKYSEYADLVQEQSKFYGSFGRPIEGYPLSINDEIEEQRAGTHNFPDERLPYVLHPQNYSPT